MLENDIFEHIEIFEPHHVFLYQNRTEPNDYIYILDR